MSVIRSIELLNGKKYRSRRSYNIRSMDVGRYRYIFRGFVKISHI